MDIKDVTQAATILAMGTQGAPAGNVTADASNPFAQLALRLLAKLDTEQAKDEAKVENARQMRFNNIQAMVLQQKMQEAKQAGCSHLLPYNGSNVRGQRTHRARTAYICQGCGKEFDDKTLPGYLFISQDLVGGPNVTVINGR